MNTNTIDAGMLAKMFLAGAKNLEAKKEWINELNVFPVPDGDTGTNMTMTIMSAAKEVAAADQSDMSAVCKCISSGSLRGARGNSGVILSQLMRGFTKVVKEHETIDCNLAAEGFEKAVETAYKAVMKPKEGTILTVAKGASEKARELANEGTDDFVPFIEEVIKYADEVLSKTPDMLPVLKQAGVVDSGGQGLVQFLKGAYDGFLGKELDLTIPEETAAPQPVSPRRISRIPAVTICLFPVILSPNSRCYGFLWSAGPYHGPFYSSSEGSSDAPADRWQNTRQASRPIRILPYVRWSLPDPDPP